MPEPWDISVSIINYRTPEMTLACVMSVLEDIGDQNVHIALIDNASGDGSIPAIEAWLDAHPEAPVSFVKSPLNTGFSGGHNLGIKAARAAFYLLLNSDAILRPGALAAFLAAGRANPNAGLIGPRVEGEDATPHTSAFRYPTPLSELIRGAETGPITRLFATRDVPLAPVPDPSQIEWVSFACVLIRHTLIEELGEMDEGYFMYFEDTDTCWRAHKAGWRVIQAPEARMVHYRGGSAPVKKLAAAKKRLPGYFYAARTRVFYKLHGRLGLLAANLAWHLGRAIAQARRLAGKPVPQANAQEWRDIWINFLDPLGDRRAPEDAG
ncbi:MAG: glycosyltransferase family 2 protein [Pseudomonadota bacterium]